MTVKTVFLGSRPALPSSSTPATSSADRMPILRVQKPTSIKLGRAWFTAHGESMDPARPGPASVPVAHFRGLLTSPETLHTVAYCNLHGLWESTIEV